MENEVIKPRISEEIDEKIDLIKKNIEFCQTNGIPEALETGGKYFNLNCAKISVYRGKNALK